jgi:hypothetical protein
MKTIEIKCQGATTLPIDAILEFQGELKKLSKENLEKLKKNILLNGFIAPMFVWDDHGDYKLLDGHQRLAALISLRQDGYDMPLLPVDIIDAQDEAEARRMLLSITSQYGEFDKAQLDEWLAGIDEEMKDCLTLIDSITDIEKNNENNPYTMKIKSPVYEIKGDKPKTHDLVDLEKYNNLIKEIDDADIEYDIKIFLKHAASRHIVFKYQDIAEYYAHESKEVQELFEKSALIILDYEKAIENGFVEMVKEIEELRNKDAR